MGSEQTFVCSTDRITFHGDRKSLRVYGAIFVQVEEAKEGSSWDFGAEEL